MMMMKRYVAIAAVAALSAAIAITCVAIDRAGAQETSQASPIYGVTLPDGYRHWELIAPALEGRKRTLPFPDGSVLVKLAWKRAQSAEFESASVPGAPTTVQVMVKDSKKYASSGGWGFGRFIDGKPTDLAQHETCFACHEARVQNHDYVFTRYAP
ncbi:cytochrome P460 family protein [Mesorhizobium sp. M1423]|uniref:cytochrome P460 family protein n=1 Tax=Mesorhizobium sp. M1423 TaxID=2957101 RepID=UPI003339A74C